jgi:DNA-binding helix-hairpin-helix protein with protein kinase domain
MFMAALKEGQVVNTLNFKTVKVLRASNEKVELGRGGQGIVYKVEYDRQPMALKWYFKNKMNNPQKFYDNIKNNIAVGRPTDAFLWPADLTEWVDDTFGYVMPLRPKEYSDFSKYLLAKINFKCDSALVNAALNIVDGFMKLHWKGFNYQDLNDGNFFVNFNTGDVLICDNDNVMGHGFYSGIAGKCRYMAPEIVRGDKMPDKQTDRFSLAVVLFMLIFANHPLEGRATVKDDDITTEADEKRFYGTDPLFIFDKDTRNAPNKLTSANAIKLWGLVPDYIRNLFIDAFDADKLHGKKPQLLESTWLNAFIRWRSEIVKCGCGRENHVEPTGGFACDCGKNRRIPAHLKFKKFDVPLYPGSELFACHTIADNEDFRTKTAEVIVSKSDPKQIGIRNLSDATWFVTGADGKPAPKGKNEVVRITGGVTIDFGRTHTAEIIGNKKEN